MSDELKPTSVEDLRKGAHASLVEFPPFPSGLPFVARIWRPSIARLMMAGKIPNPLLTTAEKALGVPEAEERKDQEAGDAVRQFGEFLDLLAGEAFLEPKWEEVRDYLSDEQLAAVQRYLLRGPEALRPFRQRQDQPDQARSDGEGVQPAAEPDHGPGPAELGGVVSGRGGALCDGGGGEADPTGEPAGEQPNDGEHPGTTE